MREGGKEGGSEKKRNAFSHLESVSGTEDGPKKLQDNNMSGEGGQLLRRSTFFASCLVTFGSKWKVRII